MRRTVRIRGVRIVLAAAAVTAGVLSAVPSANAGDVRPAGFEPVVADQAAGALVDEAGVSTDVAMQRLATQDARVELGRRLVDRAGAAAAGFWLDQTAGTVVVNVTDDAAADAVRDAGATAKVVTRGTAELDAIRDRLTANQPADTAVGIDVPANQVVVQIGAKAPAGAALDSLAAAAAGHGSAVRVERLDSSFTTLIEGGYPIVGASGGRCSLGFTTTGNTGVTAGHCTGGIPQWWEGCCGGGYYGPSVGVSFPGNDFGLIRNDGGLYQGGTVYLYNGANQDIVTAADPYPGLAVCKSGSTSGLTCGQVYQVNVTICYAEGCVGGLAQSNTYAAPGDSGGSWFNGGTAVGLTSGGGGGWTYFQPVVEALNAYGVWVF